MKYYYIYYVKHLNEKYIIYSQNEPNWFRNFSKFVNPDYKFRKIDETYNLDFAMKKYQAEEFRPYKKMEVV